MKFDCYSCADFEPYVGKENDYGAIRHTNPQQLEICRNKGHNVKIDNKYKKQTVKIETVDEIEILEREKITTPLQQIEQYLNTQIKEDPKLVKQLLRVYLSAYTDNPLNLFLLAPSSDGKTYATVKVSEIFPKKDIILVGRMSPTALIHQNGFLIDENGEPIQEKLDELEDLFSETADKNEKNRIINQIKSIKENARYCVDLKNKILVFLDNPKPETYEMLKPIMSHDKDEIVYKTTKSDGSLKVKEAVIRNWAAFVFCSAKNEAKNEVWEEIKTRVIMASPNSNVKKYQACK